MKFLESGHYGIPHLIALNLLNIYSFKLRFEVLFLVIQVFKVIVKRILSNRTACYKADKLVAGCFDLGKPLLYLLTDNILNYKPTPPANCLAEFISGYYMTASIKKPHRVLFARRGVC